jgi:D-alanyl-D-alanine dipeptidase
VNNRRGKAYQPRQRLLLIAFIISSAISIALIAALLVKTGSIRAEWNRYIRGNNALQEDIEEQQAVVKQLEEKNNELKKTIAGLTDENTGLKDRITEAEHENLVLKQQVQQREAAYRAEVFNNLVDVQALDPDILVDLRYADENNFMNRQVYPDKSRALLRRETAIKLIKANEIFKKDGYTIKIWDAYRPLSVQRIMWEHSPLPGYIAHPDTGSKHNRGAAVDMTLVDEEGRELEMPTGFDDFSEKAARDYANHSSKVRENIDYMTRVMVSCGFRGIRTEWWHFEDLDANNYPLLDVGLDSF